MHSLIPAFALGATDPEEAELVKARLAVCPHTAEELADFAELSEALLYAAPPLEAPASVEAKLRRALAGADASAPARMSWRHRLAALWQPPAARWSAAAALVLLALLVGTNLYWSSRVTHLQTAQADLLQRLIEQDNAIAEISAGRGVYIELPGADDNATAHATVLFTPDGKQGVFYAEDFPPLPEGMVYQLWLIEDGQRVSGGLFRVNEEGLGMSLIQAPQPILSYDAMGVTPEPEGGSPGPTAPPVVFGAF
ncbi:MAG: hypothetical protein D6790_14690 [Caldilineae bacterium]|nr:MAG: hypothetical protein D6790_14690 [Caldilineae bacterium]